MKMRTTTRKCIVSRAILTPSEALDILCEATGVDRTPTTEIGIGPILIHDNSTLEICVENTTSIVTEGPELYTKLVVVGPTKEEKKS